MKKCVSKFVIFIAVSVLLSGLTGCSLPSFRFSDDGRTYEAGDADVTGTVRNLEIGWASGSVKVVAGDVDSVEIREVTSKEAEPDQQVHWCLQNGTLYVRYSAPNLMNTSLSMEKELTVMLPKDLTIEKVEVDSASAAVLLEGFRADEITVDTASGDITCNASASDIEIESASGVIDLTQRGSAKEVSLETASGKILADIEKISALSIESASGRVTLKVPKDSGFTMELKQASGGFESALPLQLKGESFVAGDGSAKFSVETSSGDVKIEVK